MKRYVISIIFTLKMRIQTVMEIVQMFIETF